MNQIIKRFSAVLLLVQLIAGGAIAQTTQVTISNGTLQGVIEPGSAVASFKGIPFAQPPVGDLRWKEPQPPKNWDGILKADHFAPNAMQKNVFGDMNFRSQGMSEDCLYLNVWTPAKTMKEKLPVLVYFYGGGMVAGDGSESRYDGASMAAKAIVALTVNYRLGIFGFFSHPGLTVESPNHSSGNYGYLDQHAALEWVRNNIAQFGGDPDHVTIAGESAGSISVSVQMASPLSKNLINAAIGESGAAIKPTFISTPLATAEQSGLKVAQNLKATSLAELRAIPAADLLNMPFNAGPNSPIIDGYLMPKSLEEIFAAGEQANVPILVGWNSAEVPYQFIMRADAPTVDNYKKAINALYGPKADEVLKLYPGNTEDEVVKSATALSSDRFIVYSTWKWAELHIKTGGRPVYEYVFSRVRPAMVAAMGNAAAGLAGGVVKNSGGMAMPKMPAPVGASHASEIEYAMGNLAGNKVYAWTADDYKVSDTMESYFANFIKTYNPNGTGLPKWSANTGSAPVKYMDINVKSQQKTESQRARYLFLEQQYQK